MIIRLRYPKHLMSCTIALAHTLTPSHTVRCLDRDTQTARDCIGRAGLSGVWLRYPKHLGVHAGAGVCALTSSRRGPTGEKVGFIENTAMRHRWGGGREVTVTSRLHRQKDTERQRKTEENVERRPVVTPRYESGGEAQALVRPARDRGLPWPKTCAARVVA